MQSKYSKFLPNDENFDIDKFPYYWVMQVYGLYIKKMDIALKRYGLDNSRRRILICTSDNPNASVSEISDLAMIKISTTTKIITKLKQEQLIQTLDCDNDNRVTRLILTEKGQDMVSKINELTQVVLQDSFEGLKPTEVVKLNETLKMISRNM